MPSQTVSYPPTALAKNATHKEKGAWGEAVVAAQLFSSGVDWIFILENSRGQGFDIIALEDGATQRVLTFIEVKYNTSRLSARQKEGGEAYAIASICEASFLEKFGSATDTSRIMRRVGPPGKSGQAIVTESSATEIRDAVMTLLNDRPGKLSQTEIDELLVQMGVNTPITPKPARPAWLGQNSIPVVVNYRVSRVMPGGNILDSLWP
ncbi:hypothetical protein RGUI_0347 [Rhodovulum sp. P5]|uniref:hypothetical protein n=1 Tax=Rhodovulum sp. P5 TaxID=1564506 RepID=UPI0009C3D5FE|nr:hypothetical protein [Rhodovulum sp. P5]ARE38488.1 hypothetical protein RGUI_0347 [Rhodovulum sp. P5]